MLANLGDLASLRSVPSFVARHWLVTAFPGVPHAAWDCGSPEIPADPARLGRLGMVAPGPAAPASVPQPGPIQSRSPSGILGFQRVLRKGWFENVNLCGKSMVLDFALALNAGALNKTAN